MGWLSKSAPPPAAPDYTALAEKTAASDQQAQTRADWANRPDISTPWGSEAWTSSQVIDPATGQPVTKWSMAQTLDPQAQATLDAQQAGDLAKANIAQQQLGRVGESFATPFDTSGMYGLAGPISGERIQAGNLDPNQFQTSGAGEGMMRGLDTGSLGAMPQADAAERQRIEGMLFDRMRPEHQQQQQALETKLANMGLQRGTPEFNAELQRQQDQQSRARFDAMQTGGAEMERMFNMGMQGRQQGWQELMGAGTFQNEAQRQAYEQMSGQNLQNYGMMQTAGAQNFNQQQIASQQNFGQLLQSSTYKNALRQQQMAEAERERSRGLNEYNALMSGTQIGAPDMPDFNRSASAGGVDYSGAGKDQYGSVMDAYNARQKERAGMMSGVTGIASAAAMAF